MPPLNKTVVITGASSGIGLASALRMGRAGWGVFATIRKESDRDQLVKQSRLNIVPIMMDVEDRSSIIAAAEEIASRVSGTGLDGLVNCAGVGVMQPLEYTNLHDLHRIFEINVFGQVAVTQALLPLLRQKRGRIVNITSIGVNLAIPFGGLLNAGKSAFAMLNDTMRLELHPFGVRVCAIEPGAIATPAVDKTLGDVEGVIRNLPEHGKAQYGPMLRAFAPRAYAREKKGSSPLVVARAVHHALTSDRPRVRYRVGKHARLLAALPRIFPESLLDSIRLRMFGMPVELGASGNGVRDSAADQLSAH
jgi:NAD(P)-dependent dehydrogenase (short-subunit alcohol dehydrogenase family)